MSTSKPGRSAGVLTPLFSVYSKNSIGTGEIPDICLLVDWCHKTGMSLLQLLPMNDMGFNFRPYDAESSFALELMYLSLEHIAGVPLHEFKDDIARLKRSFPCTGDFFDIVVKKEKLDVLRRMFLRRGAKGEKEFDQFAAVEKSWLLPYAQYKVLKDRFGLSGWMSWPDVYRDRDPQALKGLTTEEAQNILFYQWLQWQLYLQMAEAKKYAARHDVRIVGDIPFLVSRDSADVWAHPGYFKLHLSAGAPPDMYLADGQEWGMPPYDWDRISKHRYDYVIQKLKYAENFYDYYRIDHFVGVFRVWTFQCGLPHDQRKKTGAFDPPDENIWEKHGRRIVTVMTGNTRMRPCAEDLGCVPVCSQTILDEFNIPGMDVQRWMRHWETTRKFKKPEEYRKNAIAVISTHDTTPLLAWWKWEAGSQEERKEFWESVGMTGPPEAEPSKQFIKACMKSVGASRSVFSVQLLQDWLSLGDLFGEIRADYRINVPGSTSDKNWRLRMPVSLEEMQNLAVNKEILAINRESKRV